MNNEQKAERLRDYWERAKKLTGEWEIQQTHLIANALFSAYLDGVTDGLQQAREIVFPKE